MVSLGTQINLEVNLKLIEKNSWINSVVDNE